MPPSAQHTPMPSSSPRGQSIPLTQQLEAEWREEIRRSLNALEDGQGVLVQKFADMDKANAEQHGQLEKKIEVLMAKYERALEESNEKLTAGRWWIKALLAVILAMAGMLMEAKLHVTTFFRSIGLAP